MSAARSGAIRVGVIGCGEIAQIAHLPLLAELTEYSVSAVCDLSPSTAEHVGRRYGADLRTTDYLELLSSDVVDAVVICTYDHAPVAESAIAHGKHLLVEKPLAFTPREAWSLVDSATERGVVALVGYMKLYDPAIERGALAVEAMRPLRSVHVHDFAGRFDRYPDLYTLFRADDVAASTFESTRAEVESRIAGMLGPEHREYAALYTLLLMLGSHDLAVLRAVCGAPEQVNYAQSRSDEELLALLEYADGTPCILEIGVGTTYEWWDEWLAAYSAVEELRLEFPNPYVRYAPTILRKRESDGPSAADRAVTVSYESPFRRELLHFGDCIRGDASPRTPLADGARDLELAVEIVRALPARRARSA
jgi:predicted dehydrogenase